MVEYINTPSVVDNVEVFEEKDYFAENSDFKVLLDSPKEERKERKVIGTHSQVFHCDEVLATCLLRYTSAYKDAVIFRTRNEELLAKCDIVCDVGS